MISSETANRNKTLMADLVIIGGGGTGLAAALSAVEKGLRNVIVLEKRSSTGGNTARARGMFAAESPAQKREMIYVSREDCFKKAMNWAHWKVNPRLVRAFIDKSGDTIRWLEEKGVQFEVSPLWINQMPPNWHIPKGYGAGLMKVLARECERMGIKIFLKAEAKKIVTNGQGNITGVLAVKDGNEFAITTHSVIISSGGYGGNRELLKKYCPYYRDDMFCGGVPNKGDGLLMATKIGAATEGLGILQSAGPGGGMETLRINTHPKMSLLLMSISLEPNTIWLNKKGERFVDETTGYNHFESVNAVIRQPDNLTFAIFDSQILRNMEEEGLFICMGIPGIPGRKLPGLEEQLRLKSKKGLVKIASSWDEMAELIGVDPKAIRTTIDEYNSNCEQGYDPIFAKERRYLQPLRTAPYYAIVCHVGFLGTIGGIKTNEHMEILDEQDNPIPGLYVGGIDAGGWQSETYCAELAGSTFSFAINSGRIAGENAAQYVFGK